MKHKLLAISSLKDIPQKLRKTPIGLLLEYHNLKRKFDKYVDARILIGMCMDHRKHLNIPDNFAYIIRSGGANLRYSEFKVSYAVAIGNVKHIALIAHDNCGMVNLVSKKKAFIDGLVKNAGWTKERAEEHFMNLAIMHEIDDEVDFILGQTARLQKKYPKLTVAPFYFKLGDSKLYLIKE